MLIEIEKIKQFENKGKIFFAGIGGVSMSSIALAFKDRGKEVCGYDSTPSAITKMLEENGIKVSYCYDRNDFEGVDLVVYTNAMSDSDPVMLYPKAMGITMVTRATALGYLMKKYQTPIGVCGTHGKSTTTGMLSYIFQLGGRNPTVFAGAELPIYNANYHLGSERDFIFEACEYKDSFLSFFPKHAIVLNVAFDHADYFLDLEDVKKSFARFIDLTADYGSAIINYDDPNCVDMAKGYVGDLLTFSTQNSDCSFFAGNISENKGFYSFDLYYFKELLCRIELGVPGYFNVYNALAAAAGAYIGFAKIEDIVRGLKEFKGVKRRFEVRGELNGAVVVDDYAHHPDEIRATLEMAKKLDYSKVTVIFQSHTYTRTRALFNEITSTFEKLCDSVIYADIYAAREEPIEGVDARSLASKTVNGKYLGSMEKIAAYFKGRKKLEGLIIVMGAGDIVKLSDMLLEDNDAR
ncbi:MAG: UDP-N-acetylmuramate--L-alanine ligase [Ruminococcaceae bacterium]|nr:UDP-N-acetylmuramate--L-alanine ligase [Oscillospiraceae bacterium]